MIGSNVSTAYDDVGDLAVRGGSNTSSGAAPIYIVNSCPRWLIVPSNSNSALTSE